jgi:hypothetical protein
VGINYHQPRHANKAVAAASLSEAAKHSWSMYTQKREWLRRLSLVNEEKVKIWFPMDRRPVIKKNGEIESVYFNSSSTGQ